MIVPYRGRTSCPDVLCSSDISRETLLQIFKQIYIMKYLEKLGIIKIYEEVYPFWRRSTLIDLSMLICMCSTCAGLLQANGEFKKCSSVQLRSIMRVNDDEATRKACFEVRGWQDCYHFRSHPECLAPELVGTPVDVHTN
jgi:hypothetical protein